MALSSSSKENISLKKLVGKSHTSNAQEAFNENKTSGLTLSTTSIFGDEIPSSPNSDSLHSITGSVEYVRLTATPLQESSVDGRFHAFKLSLPGQYEDNSSNEKSGTAPFINSTDLHSSTGSLQLVPPNFSNSYEAKVYHGNPDENGDFPVGQRIFLLDERSWYLDYFSGILFQETPPENADLDPTFVDAYIYIGDMANQKITTAASTGSSNLNELQDVTIGGVALAEDQVLVYTSSNVFENQALSSSQLSDASSLITTSSSIADLNDVNTVEGIADGNVLAWVTERNRFEFTAPAQTYTDEMARNAVGTALADGGHTGITFTNNNDGNTIDAVVSLASTNLTDSNLLARLADPDFTGTPTAPTAALATSNTQIATTSFVHQLIDSDISELGLGTASTLDDTDVLLFGTNITELSGVTTAGAVEGQVLKFNADGDLVPQNDEGKTQEQIEDIVGAMIGAATEDITVTYNDNNDGAGNISYSINDTIARINSPGFTGTPTAPTAALATSNTQIATTAFVHDLIDSDINALNLANTYQPLNASLTSISNLNTQQSQLIYTTAANTFATSTITDYARGLLDDVNATAARTTLGLGTAATSSTDDFLSSDTALGGLSNVSINSISDAQILIYDIDEQDPDNVWKNVSITGDISITSSGVTSIKAGVVSNSKLANAFINISDGTNTDKLNLGETISFTGTNDQISVTSSADVNGNTPNGLITIGLPDDVVISNDLTVSRNLTVTGDFTVNGSMTTLNTQNLDVTDSIIRLNNGLAENVDNPANNDIGILFNRGDNLNPALLFWDENDDIFKLGTHSGVINTNDLGDNASGFSYSELKVYTADQSINDNTVATTAWATTKITSEVSNIEIGNLSDVDTTDHSSEDPAGNDYSPEPGQVLKWTLVDDSDPQNLVYKWIPADDTDTVFQADTTSLWEVSADGTELYPHGIIDGTIDTGMFAIELSAGSIDLSGPDTTIYDIVNAIQNMNAYTLSARDMSDINDTYWEFVDPNDPNSDIMPKAAV